MYASKDSNQHFSFRVAKAGIEPATYRFSGGRSYQLSYLAVHCATQTGLEPATSAVTGRRANQLRYWAFGTPDGIRTRVTAVKGRRPRPLDDRGLVPKTTSLV